MDKGIIEIKAEDIFPYIRNDPFDCGVVKEIGIEGKGKGKISTEIENVLSPSAPDFSYGVGYLDGLVKKGEIAPRDFKVRFNGCEVLSPENISPRPKVAIFRYGVTHFSECKEDMDKSKEDFDKLKQLGKEYHQDQGYYLARGMGAVVLPMTSDRQIVIGVRQSKEYDGQIHGPAGWLTFHKDVDKISPRADGYKELHEELAVGSSDVLNMHLLGVVAYPKTLETDVIYFARLAANSGYFQSGAWKEAVDAKEHRELITLSSPHEILQLVHDGKPPRDSRKFEVLPSTAYGLEILARCWKNI